MEIIEIESNNIILWSEKGSRSIFFRILGTDISAYLRNPGFSGIYIVHGIKFQVYFDSLIDEISARLQLLNTEGSPAFTSVNRHDASFVGT